MRDVVFAVCISLFALSALSVKPLNANIPNVVFIFAIRVMSLMTQAQGTTCHREYNSRSINIVSALSNNIHGQ